MNSFLEYVAQDILNKYGTNRGPGQNTSASNLSRIAVVFPNKRAALFMNEYLARQSSNPLWSPTYMTISELFRSHSLLRVADPIKLVCDLHRTYTAVTGYDETLDHFYGWGQLLITDFDDVDKNMALADKVFANLRDIHELDDISFLNDEQKVVIKKFFANFTDDHSSLLKERFLRLWSHMGDIYKDFNHRLLQQGLAYEGALYRQVADDESLNFEYNRYLFVGFNLLQAVEQRLFTRLKNEGKAAFYWDFDHDYMTSEAGHFISQHLAVFPNELDIDDNNIYRNFRRPKTIEYMAAPTENAQARYISQWLKAHPDRIKAGRRTAIVLCNEGMLQTIVHQLPDEVKNVNITTGYPLQQAPISSLIAHLFALYQQGYDHQHGRYRQRYVRQVMSHPYARYIEDSTILTDIVPDSSIVSHLTTVVSMIAQRSKDDSPSPLMTESLFRAYTLLNRLSTLVKSGDLKVDLITMQRLTMQLIQQTTIPFHGEPVVGLQVMGILETRNLDFDHILLLSCNEGNMPRGVNDSSFIPYSIRRAYGLTTADHKVAIYAYYFNRLLSRASDITIAYNNATTDGRTAEMSRFMLQLMVEDKYHRISHHILTTLQHSQNQQPQAILKSSTIMDKLRQRFMSSILSPTAINRYMRCPLQFYYCYVEGLKEPDETEEGIIDNRTFGIIFHHAAQLLYERLMQKSCRIMASDLDHLLKTRVEIERAVDEAFNQEVDIKTIGGIGLINREVIIQYLRQLVTIDRRLAPFTILKLEEEVKQKLPVRSLGFDVTIGGVVDRMDIVNMGDGEQIRIIDYKTGSQRLNPLKTVNDIFDDSQLHNHSDYYLQTLLYARIVRNQQKKIPVAPALLFIQHAAADDYNPILKFGTEFINDVASDDGNKFVRLLSEKVDEMFDPSVPFTPTSDHDRCRFCPYKSFCGL